MSRKNMRKEETEHYGVDKIGGKKRYASKVSVKRNTIMKL
jgi:hypothetical protein